MINSNKSVIRVMLVTSLVLMVPLVAMQFTEEVNWDLFDFIIAGVFLSGTGLAYELVVRKINNDRNRVLIAMLLMAVLLLIWAELAVGVFNTPISGS